MVKILLLTAMHQRPHISELFCISAMRLLETWKYIYDITVVSLVSDSASETVCMKYNIDMIHTPVSPLGMKMNVGMANVLTKYSFDYLLHIGDDDIFSPDILEIYSEAIELRRPYFGFNQVYFYDLLKNRAIHFKYPFDTNKLIGAGRMFLCEALEKTAYKCSVVSMKSRTVLGIQLEKNKALILPEYQAKYMEAIGFGFITSEPTFQLWKNDQTKGLDTESELNMVFNGFFPHVIESSRPLITDIKSLVNVWQFEDYLNFSVSVSPEESMYFCGETEKEHLKLIRKSL
jgi:hypothetical protein